MVKKYMLLLLALASLQASELLIQNIPGRQTTTLNGVWNYIVDPYENGFYNYRYTPFDDYGDPSQSGGYFTNQKPVNPWDRIEYDFDKSEAIIVPGDWNSQKEKLYYYEGTIWYKRSFDYEKTRDDNRVFVHFGAINYKADVYLNGQKLGVHKGGFTPFNFEITDIVRPKDNFLIVKVDNTRKKDEVPTVNTDWWNFGGLTRDVSLIEVSSTFVSDYFIQLEKGSKRDIKGYIQLDGEDKANRKVIVDIPGLRLKKSLTTDVEGSAELELNSREIKFWSPDNPMLYDINIQLDTEVLSDRIGFRTLATRNSDILLNGESIFLRGICIHEENPIRGGRAYSMEDSRLLLGWAKELGCNYVRLAHYPHNENMLRLADEMGIMVWEENPVYWTISWENKQTYSTAQQQLSEVISRDKNRASVIIWSMANETPVSDARMEFLKNLRNFALSKDDTRLISAALEMQGSGEGGLTRKITDPFAEFVDILSFNAYIGWYDGLPDKCDKIQWAIDQNKPVIVSEFGAGALQGLHGAQNEIWTEEYQENIYAESIEMFQRLPQLRGTSPWILSDFHSPRRVLPGIQDGWNRKGLIGETGDKKKAFYVMQKFYQDVKATWE
ncbi:MAG: beta-glucuronidase [Candidatus Marinimicrobia bacterium]|jgi:beta-glucuronidase|nr:beta-glucuronidase [Candidatus Neomarinimicrobiota bacterium]MBT4361613.1 beta-glucuronidase [Candidatus Neomarinimicrobiota bacterium]MBT4714023.1 beta-glucuronidase [Candidatus Neomarinimicrobiota bacterium]MBT4947021.1 beta-glucuronidase [Candidatus Neomarinimicrobiota bacterium]MBT5268481.1 beta-glucuronidase [Candidatus Neomarinimicrobiota bacterium]